jgi:hypothetical protein
MSFEVKTLSLSSLAPLRLTYDYNSKEELDSRYRVVDSGLRYHEHELLEDCADGAFSQHNAIILTKIKDIKSIFAQPTTYVDVRTVACCFYLSVQDTEVLSGDTVVKKYSHNFYVGGKGTEVIFNAIPVEEGIIELKVNNQQLAVAENYPYDLILLDEPLQENIYRQRFAVDVYGDKISLKNETAEGYRYVSFSADRILRSVGLQLNETTINSYLFAPIFLSTGSNNYDFNPSTKEIRYYNEFGSTDKEKRVDIKTQMQLDTNLVVSCLLEDVISEEEVNVNIAITKTNFATSGTFNTSL